MGGQVKVPPADTPRLPSGAPFAHSFLRTARASDAVTHITESMKYTSSRYDCLVLQHVNASTAALHELHDILAPEAVSLRVRSLSISDVLHQIRPSPAHSCADHPSGRIASDADTASEPHAPASPWPRHAFSVEPIKIPHHVQIPRPNAAITDTGALTTSSASTSSAVRRADRLCFASTGANARNSAVRSAILRLWYTLPPGLPTRLKTYLVD